VARGNRFDRVRISLLRDLDGIKTFAAMHTSRTRKSTPKDPVARWVLESETAEKVPDRRGPSWFPSASMDGRYVPSISGGEGGYQYSEKKALEYMRRFQDTEFEKDAARMKD
jgi:hypothetical protein